MAQSLPTPCSHPTCPETSTERFCEGHRSEKWEGDDRPNSAERGYGPRHRRWRKKVLARDPLCVHCLERGDTVPSTVADHITPWQRGGSKYALENGQGLCQTCHNQKTAKETA